ncbi:hypothetical protein HLH32_12930 [Gluconacetobacter liquefaciens]|uniref:Uncharacterized protein YciW n=1 Tax=Gluconacetobacter liquefaciens TaxID=89584 RepID=A0A370FZD1_GLULI|nr:hypothetical protein [Gluconacetobacter liquefaciens]MBB2187270.1 hypothetical protein [Gluconacetobacter liquefaciens]RDI36815.1 uncharacterized protein YciW [Gluconacetobacter liquefaciens]
MTDAIDEATGLVPGDALFALRRQRPDFVTGAELCRHALLTPADDQGLAPPLRLALARRMAALNADGPLTATYDAALDTAGARDDLTQLAAGKIPLPGPLRAMALHCDRVTRDNRSASEADIAALAAASLSTPQIIALSELIAFVNYQCRVTAGLRLLKD